MMNETTNMIIPRQEYEDLIRESQTIALVKRMLLLNKYFSQEDLKLVLGVKETQAKMPKETISFEEILEPLCEKEGEE